ncbi:MAG: CHASE2 domain-containing protein, partial [Candidatus Tectomicrobia bacterium]|nr:CHASE2 domain-containing protein [Candidatus Tectomicrobia bacterium]
MHVKPVDDPAMQISGWSSANAVQVLTRAQGRPIALVVVVLLVIFHIAFGHRYWHSVRHTIFDAYQRILPRRETQWPVIIVDIDQASLQALGNWPWSRSRLAKLLEVSWKLGARAVGLDLIMPESDRLSPSVFLADRQDVSTALREQIAELPSPDDFLAGTLFWVPSVVGRAGMLEDGRGEATLPQQPPVQVQGSVSTALVPAYPAHIANMPEFEQRAFGHGYLNGKPDADGVVRTMPLLVQVNGILAPSLALELIRVAEAENDYRIHGSRRGISRVEIGASSIPTDRDGGIRLYYARTAAKRRVSALTILNRESGASVLLDRIVLIGVTGVGLTDIVATPVDPRMDGVEVQAQLIESIYAGIRLVRPWPASWLELTAFLAVATALVLLMPRVRPSYNVVFFLLAVAVLTALSFLCFVRWKWLLDPSFPSVGNAMLLIVLLIAGFAAADRRRRELRETLVAERIERSRIDGQLSAARDIQMGMLPTPETIAGLPATIEFHAIIEPAEEVGGDLYDAFMLDEHHFFFLVGDVSGKGVPASLFMALSKTLCKSLALREHVPLAALLRSVNTEISRENPTLRFVTAVTGIIDVRTGEL